MSYCTAVVIIVLISSAVQPAVSNKQTQDDLTCSLNIHDDLSKTNDPLLLIESSTGISIVYPVSDNKDGIIFLGADEKLIVACPGKQSQQNAVVINNKEIAVGVCSRKENKLVVEGKEASATDLQCEYSITPELQITNDICGNGVGTFLELGYTVESKWYTIISICHNIDKADTYFTTHKLYGPGLGGAIISSQRKAFIEGSKQLYKNIKPDFDYKQENQKNLLNKLLGGNLGDFYYYEKNFFARGHMSPDADFIYKHEQLLTYFFVNVAPQWQSINGGNWVVIENTVRKVATELNTTLIVTTGTFGVLKLPNINGKLKEIYFEPNTLQLRVPDTIWKLVVNPDDNSCVVLLSVNNAFIESPPETICADITKTSGWPSLQDNYMKGYIYTCDYGSFKKAVAYAPDFACKNVLKLPFSVDSNKRRKTRQNGN